MCCMISFFFFNDTATTEIYTLSLHDALPIFEVFGPSLIRNGEFFEMRFRIRATETIGEPVIAVDDAVWEDLTVNTLIRSEEHTSELQSRQYLVCRLLLEKKKQK